MNVTLTKVLRNSFKDKDGKDVSYCKFSCLVPSPDNENSVGFDVYTYTTKYDNFNLLVDFLKKGETVKLECDFLRTPEGLYRAKPKAIDDVTL